MNNVEEQARAATAGRGDLITIHVCDEQKKLSRDFRCSKRLLLSEMAYFRGCPELNSKQYENDDISITVYCDLETFSWLHLYISAADADAAAAPSPNPPPLAPNSVLSVLISADFLRMRAVTDLCINFIAQRLDETLEQPIDFSCLNDALLARIAAAVRDTDLAVAKDPQDKLSSRLYRHKVGVLLAAPAPLPPPAVVADTIASAASGVVAASAPAASGARTRTLDEALRCCSYCGAVFCDSARPALSCPAAPFEVDFRGRARSLHSAAPAPGWTARKAVSWMRADAPAGLGLPWAAVYWRLWAAATVLWCDRCGQSYQAHDLNRCAFHPQAPRFAGAGAGRTGSDWQGVFPCCGARASRMRLGLGAGGWGGAAGDAGGARADGCEFQRHCIRAGPRGARYDMDLDLGGLGVGVCLDVEAAAQADGGGDERRGAGEAVAAGSGGAAAVGGGRPSSPPGEWAGVPACGQGRARSLG
eukprot:g6661.t1